MGRPAISGMLRSALTVFVIAVLTLAALELLLRIADFRELRQDVSERSLSYGYDAELGWAPIPNSVSTVTTARTIHATHNSLGFRDIEFAPDGRPVILFIGDSFVWGVDAEANERFTDLLRGRLTQFQIVNAGVSGYGTDQEYLWLKRIWATIRPAVVVVLFCTDNDRKDNSTNLRYGRYHKPYFVIGSGRHAGAARPARAEIAPALHQGQLAGQNLWLARLAVAAYVELLSPEVSVADPTEHLVDGIHEFVSANHAKLLFALQSRDDRLAAHLEADHIPFTTLDGAAAYGAQYGSHFTPEGHEFASRRLMELYRLNDAR